MTIPAVSEGAEPVPDMNEEKQCAGVTTAGGRCNAPRDLLRWDEEDQAWYCFTHDPTMEQERDLSRVKAGMRTAAVRRRHRYLMPAELPELNTPDDAKAYAKLITEAVATGRLSSAAAGVALKALAEWRAGYEAVEVAQQIEWLKAEALLAKEDREARRRDRRAGRQYMGMGRDDQ